MYITVLVHSSSSFWPPPSSAVFDTASKNHETIKAAFPTHSLSAPPCTLRSFLERYPPHEPKAICNPKPLIRRTLPPIRWPIEFVALIIIIASLPYPTCTSVRGLYESYDINKPERCRSNQQPVHTWMYCTPPAPIWRRPRSRRRICLNNVLD
ncbi:hypothetical protein BDBG_17750 [Blastomyces gilchristii SLH14081]|uniref:Uncharacterized protein n=1 Tax=Blastomyces gilchristii (strain SLH14081) TaxID=559298 RepID=A0A179V1J5_BLAGS|nr:uncharacterized protein BDBG_17750 [Blastomyces gilchristii SLH14081]OAT13201.1 hypothetical protein BDBG_17750 [Blastomyces gilchristii SLH14081]